MTSKCGYHKEKHGTQAAVASIFQGLPRGLVWLCGWQNGTSQRQRGDIRHLKQATLLFCFVWILQRREDRKDEARWGEVLSVLQLSQNTFQIRMAYRKGAEERQAQGLHLSLPGRCSLGALIGDESF